MAIEVTCSHCGGEIVFADELAGSKVECEGCKRLIRVPYQEEPAWERMPSDEEFKARRERALGWIVVTLLFTVLPLMAKCSS